MISKICDENSLSKLTNDFGIFDAIEGHERIEVVDVLGDESDSTVTHQELSAAHMVAAELPGVLQTSSIVVVVKVDRPVPNAGRKCSTIHRAG